MNSCVLGRCGERPRRRWRWARIVLGCAQGQTNRDVAARLHTTAQTVSKWRRRFVEGRPDGLPDIGAPGRRAQSSMRRSMR